LFPSAKIWNPTTTPSGVLNSDGRKKEERKINLPKIVATFVYASSQGQRTHSAQTKMLKELGKVKK
jgi:hypothetical protein